MTKTFFPDVGLQTCFHFAKFGWPGTQSHTVRECTHSWYVCRYQGIPRLRGYAGVIDYWHPLHFCSFFSYTGLICSHFCPSLFSHRSCNRFRALLQQHSRAVGRSGGKGWSQSVNDMVESVRCFQFVWIHAHTFLDKYFHFIQRLRAFLPRTVSWRGFIRSMQSIEKGHIV